MSVLITGGAGYIGSHAVLSFLEAGHDIIVVDDLSTGHQALLPKTVKFYRGNAGDPVFMSPIFAAHKIDTVLHFAGSIVVPESVENPLKYYQNNTFVSLALLKLCVDHKIKNFIFSSTGTVYSSTPNQKIKEDFIPAPENPYAASKLMTERIIEDSAKAHGFNYIILRYFNVAGADPQGRTGQMAKNATHLIKVACEVAVGKRTKIEVFGTDYETRDGTCIRDYIHVSDLADAHLKAYDYMAGGKGQEIFNCGYGTGSTVLEVIKAVEKVSKTTITKQMSPRRAGDPVVLVADSTRLMEKTGWKPRFNNLETIIQSALAWESKIK